MNLLQNNYLHVMHAHLDTPSLSFSLFSFSLYFEKNCIAFYRNISETQKFYLDNFFLGNSIPLVQ